MALIEKDGFKFITNLADETSLLLNDEQFNSQIKYIKTRKLKKLCLRKTNLSNLKDLSFLQEMDFVTDISITDLDIDFSGLYYLKYLEELSVDIIKKTQNIDFSKFPKLKKLTLEGGNVSIDLTLNLELRELLLYKYNPKSKSLKELKFPPNLHRFKLNSSNITNFEGIESLNLEIIETYYCPNLISTKGLDSQKKTLNTLIIENSKKLNDYEYLNDCLELQKLTLFSCGDISSINWVEKLNKLKVFVFYKTKVLDNDYSVCEKIAIVSKT